MLPGNTSPLPCSHRSCPKPYEPPPCPAHRQASSSPTFHVYPPVPSGLEAGPVVNGTNWAKVPAYPLLPCVVTPKPDASLPPSGQGPRWAEQGPCRCHPTRLLVRGTLTACLYSREGRMDGQTDGRTDGREGEGERERFWGCLPQAFFAQHWLQHWELQAEVKWCLPTHDLVACG